MDITHKEYKMKIAFGIIIGIIAGIALAVLFIRWAWRKIWGCVG